MAKKIGFIIEGRSDLLVVLVLLLWSTASRSSNVSTTTETVPTTIETTSTATTSVLTTPTPPWTMPAQRVPSQPPTNLTVTPIDPCFILWKNCGLSKLRVEWDPPPAEDRNGIIILYEIYYIGAEFDTELHTANVSGNVYSMTLSDLEEYVIYDVRIRAFTHVGPSSFSLVQSVRTYAAPSESPTNISFLNVTSNSSINEILYECSHATYDYEVYKTICACNWDSGKKLVTNGTEFVLNLKSYAWYEIHLWTITKTGPTGQTMRSDWEKHVVLTAENRPGSAPQNLSVAKSPGRRELFITWKELPCKEVHGTLQKYVIYYQREDKPLNVSISISPSSNNYTLSNLEFFTEYSVWMQAFTGAGGGPLTDVVQNRTDGPAAVIHTCEALQGNQGKVKAIRLNYTDVSMSDWRGERRGYRVNLFKGNKAGIGQVFSDTKYVGQSVGGSDTLEVDESTIDFDQWYTVTMKAESRADCGQTTVGPSSNPCQFLIPSTSEPRGKGSMSMVIAVALFVAVLVLIVLVIVIICVRKRRRHANLEVIQLQELQNQQYDASGGAHWLMTWPTYDEFQFSKDRPKIEDELGEGHFGKVYSAWATGIVKDEDKTRVAVKTMERGSSQETAEDFRKEMEIMMYFDHPNIVRLLGICTHDEPLYLITELMKHGDLKDYIRKARPNEMHPRPLLSIAQLVDVAAQAASGVAYLASRKFVHRDIAARNCLVGENDNQLSVKISDFCMARDMYQGEYYRRRGGTLPIRWMAPETIAYGKYTVESDVWSLSVLLWEIFALGYKPYFGRDDVIGGILQGSLTLECPPLCPRSVFQLMLRCWERNPSERIQSGDVANALQDMRDLCDDGSEGVYDLALDQRYVSRKKVAAEPSKTSSSYLNMTPTQSKPPPVEEDYLPMSPITPSGTKLDPMFEEEALLLPRDVPSTKSGDKCPTIILRTPAFQHRDLLQVRRILVENRHLKIRCTPAPRPSRQLTCRHSNPFSARA
ncbi:uncharacterized protein [Oscarella lobularis]|uniref:uncharacterized protein isoform X2 n=1 Tax=Oscarella lobularis TaxID=121494 RepID=UPI00331406D5